MSNFIHLHTHSDYSPQDGAQSCEQIATKAAKLGMNAVALTDHGRCGGMLKFKKACQKVGIKPIYGFEAYVAPESRFTKSKLDDHKKTSYHLTLLAKNEKGLRNLFTLTSLGWLDGFYYKPRIDNEILKTYREGLIALSGCPSGRLAQYIMDGKIPEARSHAREMRNIFGDDFYLEVQNHGFDWEQSLKGVLFDFADTVGIPIVATQDSHYQEKEDWEVHNAICKIAAGDLEFGTDQIYFKSREEMEKIFEPEEHHALDITQEIADKCNCDWKHDTTIWPVFDLPEGKQPEESLRELAWEGFEKLFGEGTEEYRDRLKYELAMIEQMGFPTYFLVVADFIDWAKKQNIPVGPGRGSGAGSLVCYCIGITNVDPIKYGLYFERFLNPARVSLPDLDIDFCKERRGEVIEYVRNKYGSDRVAQIGTYAVFKPRGSLRDFARVLGYDRGVGDKLAGMVPPDDAGKALSFDQVIEKEPGILKTQWPKVVEFSRKAESLNRQAGIHAAGVIISNDDLKTQIPLFCGKNDEVTAQFDMNDVEDVGLVKYDFLGLKNLTVIQETVNLIKKHHGVVIDIDKIDEHDEEVYSKAFQRGKLDGIFQFETSSGFRDLCVKVNPKSIEDLSTITALFRPGPLETGLTDQYVKGRNGAAIQYPVEKLRPILEPTYGVMTFQEQIMRICTDLAGYTLPEADNMRKIIGKKIREKMELEREKFVGGCIKNGVSESIATKLFDDIAGFAKYCFNKSHSVAYSIISYQTAWLRTHYPTEFYTALLNSSFKDQSDLVKYIYACKDDEIPIMPPDVNVSEGMFTINNGTIIFGLAGIKGLGTKACQSLVEEREANGPFKSIEDMVQRKINKGVIKALASCGALAEITEFSRGQLVEHLDELHKYYEKYPTWLERVKKIREKEDLRKIEFEEKQRIRDEKIARWKENPKGKEPQRLKEPKPYKIPEEPQLPEMNKIEDDSKQNRLTLERQTLGFYLTGHPMDRYPGLSRMSRYTIADIKGGKDKEGKTIANATPIAIPIVISSIRDVRTKKDIKMAAISIEDKSGRMEATIFPRQWKRLEKQVEEDTVNILRGTIQVAESENEDSPPIVKMVVNDLELVTEDSEAGQIHPINVVLVDGTKIQFIPDKDVDYNAYQQALAITKNMQRMR